MITSDMPAVQDRKTTRSYSKNRLNAY